MQKDTRKSKYHRSTSSLVRGISSARAEKLSRNGLNGWSKTDAALAVVVDASENGCRPPAGTREAASVTATVSKRTLRDPKNVPHGPSGKEQATDRQATATCPVCGGPIEGVDADARATVSPCGHSAAETTLTTFFEQA
ncbi:hypothetical protein EGH26_10660 [Halomicroarcula pellucida]|nr:hypothetical protein [Halomicroarcula pellucida]